MRLRLRTPRFIDGIVNARARGWRIEQADDGVLWIEAPDQATADAAQTFLDAHDPMQMERGQAAARVRAEADRRVDTLAPAREREALLAQAIDLNDRRMAGESWSAEDAAAADRMRQLQRLTRRIRRAAARIIEAEVAPLATTDACLSYDPAASTRWPNGAEDSGSVLPPINGTGRATTAAATGSGTGTTATTGLNINIGIGLKP